MTNEYEKDIHIDESSIDTEWLEQPMKMFKYCALAAQTRMDLDKAKEALDIIKAEIDKEVRNSPSDYGLDKVTDKAIESITITQKNYIRVNNEYIQARYENEMVLAAVRAIDQRKDALENLVRLHGQQYFAGPKEPHNITQQRNKKVLIRKT